MKKLVLLFILVTSMTFGANDYIARGIYSIDGKMLEGENGDIKQPLASLTKLMTALVTLDKIAEGKISLDTVVTINEDEAKIEESKVVLKEGDKLTVEDLLHASVVAYANNATLALARVVGGNEVEFVKLMNAKAKELGLKNTVFYTSTGLTTEKTGKKLDLGSVNDFAKFLTYASKNRDFLDLINDEKTKIKNNTMTIESFNKNLAKNEDILAIKTGFNANVGYNFMFITHKDNKAYFVIVFGTATEESRDKQIKKEINTLDKEFRKVTLVSAGEFIIEGPLKDGKVKRVELFASKNIIEEIKDTWKLNKYVFLPKEIKAPIKKGEKVGTYVVSYDGREIGRTDLITNTDVLKSSVFDEIKKRFTK